ncbi:MAG TPA: putative DNA-binding domain-containing protein [Polyangia bacterium]
MDDLASLQRRFFALITAREEISGALTRHGLTEADAAAFVQGDERLGSVGRLGIYNDMYFFRLLGILEEDFPLLAAALGQDGFRTLIADYLEAFMPPDHALRNLGSGLPAFLAQHQLAGDRRFLVDLASLEWAKADVLDRVDTPALTTGDLQTLSPEEFATMRLQPAAAATFLDLAHPLDQFIEALEAEVTNPPLPTPAATRVLIWRVGAGANHRTATPDEAVALPRLFADPPPTFAEICDMVGQGHSVEAAAPRAFGVLAGWLQIGLIRRA